MPRPPDVATASREKERVEAVIARQPAVGGPDNRFSAVDESATALLAAWSKALE